MRWIIPRELLFGVAYRVAISEKVEQALEMDTLH
jgi:hypothetical protein